MYLIYITLAIAQSISSCKVIYCFNWFRKDIKEVTFCNYKMFEGFCAINAIRIFVLPSWPASMWWNES